jgi:hypothetical protein
VELLSGEVHGNHADWLIVAGHRFAQKPAHEVAREIGNLVVVGIHFNATHCSIDWYRARVERLAIKRFH